MSTRQRAPKLSIVAVFHNMRREAPRTLQSLSPPYQQNVDSADYEIIAVDNGSSSPSFDPATSSPKHIKLLNNPLPTPSPASAVNWGVLNSSAEYVGILIDGARMASPGLLHLAMECLVRHAPAVVSTVGFHLGPDVQTRSQLRGYDQYVEDQLLEKINWVENGYKLFENSTLAGSSLTSWLHTTLESNLLFMPRAVFDDIGGLDESFRYPGGGFVNLDFYKRAAERLDVELFSLLGEATFHQFHGGVMANRPAPKVPAELERYRAEYLAIRGDDYAAPTRRPKLHGFARPETIPWILKSAQVLLED